MPKKAKNRSITSRTISQKLKISFCLMSVLPLLVCVYLVSNYILPLAGLHIDVWISVFVSMLISLIGFFVIKDVFDRITSFSGEAKKIIGGDLSRNLDVDYADEVGDLGLALNHLTQHIRSNMDELKSYSEKTRDINIEVQKRVIELSSILQISSLISQGEKLGDVLKIITDKVSVLAESEVSFLLMRLEGEDNFLMEEASGKGSELLLRIVLNEKDELFARSIKSSAPLILDNKNHQTREMADYFSEKFHLKNALLIPVYSKGRAIAILGVGNSKESFQYQKEDIELLDLFAKHIAIAVDNDVLVRRLEKLEIKDQLTGLYNQPFIRNRLQEEIKRAITYQRPCSFVLLDIDYFGKFHESFGATQSEAMLKKIVSVIRDSVTEIDRIGRTGENEFAIILPERNKRQGLEIAENIRQKIEFVFSEEEDKSRKFTISGGVSENPLDGIDAKQLIAKAQELLQLAKKQGRNKIVSFLEPPLCR
jgi:diguanylate cyclase (GGDEF)-like protein